MKILGWLGLILLVACKSSLQDSIDDKVRRCGQHRYEPRVIEGSHGRRYDVGQRSALRLTTLDGQDRSEFLTSQACLDLPPDAEDYLLSDASTQSFAIVSGQQESVRLALWTLPKTDWSCPQAGFFLHNGQELPLNLDWPFAGKGQSLKLELQDIRSESRITKLVKQEGGFRLSLDDGSYLAGLKLINPFGAEIPLGQGCPLSLHSQKPAITFLKEPSQELVIHASRSPELRTHADVTYSYCLSAADEAACTSEWRTWDAWQVPAFGDFVFMHIRALDRHGNENIRGPIKARIDRQAPLVRFSWKDALLNRFGHVERLPYFRYNARIELNDDGSSGTELEDRLQCRVLVQEKQSARSGAGFAVCEDQRCQGQQLDEWVSCSRDFSFRIDPSFWPLHTKDRRPLELIAEVRTEDGTGKPQMDSGLLMLDPSNYPDFEAQVVGTDLLRGQIHKVNNKLFILHDQQILQRVSFGKTTALPDPGDQYLRRMESSPSRLIAITGELRENGTILEYDFSSSTWKTLHANYSWTFEAPDILLPNSNEVWIVGEDAESIMTRVADGAMTSYACPVLQNELDIPERSAVFNDDAFLFYRRYYITFNLRSKTCTKHSFASQDGFNGGTFKRSFYRDLDHRIWAFDEQQIDVFENGQWQHFSRKSLGLPAGDFIGAARVGPTQMVFFQPTAMYFIADYEKGQAVVLNAHNSDVANRLGPIVPFAGIDAVFVQGGELQAIINGVLSRIMIDSSGRSVFPRVFESVQSFTVTGDNKVLMGYLDGHILEVSNKSLMKSDQPMSGAAGGMPIFRRDEDDLTVRKFDWVAGKWQEDQAFTELGFTLAVNFPKLDHSGRLWFVWAKDGDARSGIYVYDGKKADRVHACFRSLRLGEAGSLCPDGFHESSTGDIYWRGNFRSSSAKNLMDFDLFRWSPGTGVSLASGAEHMFSVVYDVESHAGRVVVSGKDQEGQGRIGILESGRWQFLELPGTGRSMVGFMGWNRQGEFFALAQNETMYLLDKDSWATLKPNAWTTLKAPAFARSTLSSPANGYLIAAYYEDGILWWKDGDQRMSQYDGAIPTRDFWWWALPR